MGWKSRTAAGALSLALGLVAVWEGYKTEVYSDPVGIPTVCYGHVVNPKTPLGTEFSHEACHALLYSDLKVASEAVKKLVTVRLKPNQEAAFISFVFNAGIGNFKKSTMLKLINEGRLEEACHELPRWVYAKGKKLKGLENRRQAEMRMCLGE